MSEPVVRPGKLGDLPELVRIYNHYVENSYATFDTEPVTVESRTGWFERFSEVGAHRLLVASEGERVLGCASSGSYREHAAFANTVEVSVYLDPELRSRGIGSALYRPLLDNLRSENVHVALAGIALPNDASIALHRKFGFTEVGVFEEYALKKGTYISSIWMQLRF
ncbi:MAG: N-acetyltransferase [Acidimicrobiaceae bacterium]|nr:N-acetyltransferase [Acidimicrobiaceae bacterium]